MHIGIVCFYVRLTAVFGGDDGDGLRADYFRQTILHEPWCKFYRSNVMANGAGLITSLSWNVSLKNTNAHRHTRGRTHTHAHAPCKMDGGRRGAVCVCVWFSLESESARCYTELFGKFGPSRVCSHIFPFTVLHRGTHNTHSRGSWTRLATNSRGRSSSGPIRRFGGTRESER